MSNVPGALVFCVDGGGTRSRGRLVDATGRRLASALSGPCNPSTDTRQALASLQDLWAACAAGSGRDARATEGVVLAIGAAGLYVPSSRAAFLEACPGFDDAVAMTDGYAALVGAGSGAPCGLVLAGTGVAGHRLYADGRSTQRDAWGWVAGDRGGGAWLGRKALRHACSARDGVLASDGLAEAVWDAIGGRAAIEAGWHKDLTPERLGALAPVVLRSADAGVAAAAAIRARAIDHLAALAATLDAADVPLYAAGGIAEVLRPRLATRLRRPVLAPVADALAGCFLVASGRAPAERADFFGLPDAT